MKPENCTLCPRRCGVNRATQQGFCRSPNEIRVARAAAHAWEEPCISGSRGSGTVFFCGCTLGCVFCQNQSISHPGHAAGKALSEEQLAHIFLRLQRKGVHNLNLVTPSHFRPGIVRALHHAKAGGLTLPVVWNTSGYETPESIAALAAEIDVWLTDLKFFAPALSQSLAAAPDYFSVASEAILQMCTQTGPPVFDAEGLLQRGTIVRLLVLPGQREDAKALLHWMAQTLPQNGFLLSLMSQYTPPESLPLPPPLHRKLSSFEYRDIANTALSLGLTQGYTQQRGSAQSQYTPAFDLTGL